MDYVNEDLPKIGQQESAYNMEEKLDNFFVNLLEDCRQGRTKSCGSVLKIMLMNSN